MSKLTKRKKLPAIKTLKNKAWTLMSNHVRTSYADSSGYVSCVTCGSTKHYKEMHAGHFIHASKGSLVSYDDRNIHPQCPKCNTYQGGSLIEYTLFIQDKYGAETIEELKQLKQTIMKRADFEAIIERLPKI
jgi:hypothetical protein